MTPYEQVLANFTLPFPLYLPQIEAVNTVAPLPRSALWMQVGTGKTPTSTVAALFKRKQVLVLCPPILGPMWRRWIAKFEGVSVTFYSGSPKDRERMELTADFIVMSIHIFKRDYDSIIARMDKQITVIVDEATSVKSIGSGNFKAVYDLVETHDAEVILLSGTPLSTPADAYAYCKMIAPGTYRNLHHFENLHVVSRDFFGSVEEWGNLELLNANMRINSVRMLKEDILPFLPAVTFTPIYYEMDPKHYRLYRRLAEEQLIELEAGGKIDATSAQKLIHALGQVILNWGYFAEDESLVSEAVKLAIEILEELGTGKLVVVGNYRMSNRLLVQKLAKFNPVAVYGEISAKNQQKNIDTFINDPTCRVLVIQFLSGGVGVDGLQGVCSDMLVLEMPTIPAQLEQAVGRLHRGGQQDPVHVRLAVAEKTLQVKRLARLLDNDDTVNQVIRNARDLRAELFGEGP